MARLPVVSAGDLIKILEQQGFRIVRQRGNHVVLQKRTPEAILTTVVPNHKELAPGTLRSILKRAGFSVEDLLKFLTVLIGIAPRLW